MKISTGMHPGISACIHPENPARIPSEILVIKLSVIQARILMKHFDKILGGISESIRKTISGRDSEGIPVAIL